MSQVWICAAGLSIATVLGAGLGFIIKALPHKWNDIVLGFCAGVMLAASTIGLILPAAQEAGASGWWTVLLGVSLVVVGCLLLWVIRNGRRQDGYAHGLRQNAKTLRKDPSLVQGKTQGIAGATRLRKLRRQPGSV